MKNKLSQKILNDIKVELKDEFDRNFERKAFFDQKWKKSKNGLVSTGKLRRSIQAQVVGNSIVFTSSVPYASIHNTGGTITVTAKMKRYFWAKHAEAAGMIKSVKNKETKERSWQKTKRKNPRVNEETEMWHRMALMKVGSKITIPQRQFIGNHPRVKKVIEQIVNENVKEAMKNLKVP